MNQIERTLSKHLNTPNVLSTVIHVTHDIWKSSCYTPVQQGPKGEIGDIGDVGPPGGRGPRVGTYTQLYINTYFNHTCIHTQ